MTNAAAGFALDASPATKQIAEKAVETIAKVSNLSKPELLNALHAMDEVINSMSGQTLKHYWQIIRNSERAFAGWQNLPMNELSGTMRDFNTALHSINSINPDILAAYEPYLEDRSFAQIFADSEMQTIARDYIKIKFHPNFPDVTAAAEETLKVLQMPSDKRGEYLDSRMNTSSLKEKANNIARAIADTDIGKRVRLEEARLGLQVWPKVQLKEYGYNIRVSRKKFGHGQFSPQEVYSDWEKRTSSIAADIKSTFPDARIEHHRFQQGRIVVLVNKNSPADEYFRDFNKPKGRQTGAVTLGR